MSGQYYIPKKEDLHIGMECEIFSTPARKMINVKDWRRVTITQSNQGGEEITIQAALQMLDRNLLRVTKSETEYNMVNYIKVYMVLKWSQRLPNGNFKMTNNGEIKEVAFREVCKYVLTLKEINVCEEELESISIVHTYK